MMTSRIEMSPVEIEKARSPQAGRLPLVLELPRRGRSPRSLYERLKGGRSHTLLLESGDGGMGKGRYSFIAVEAERIFSVSGDGCRCSVHDGEGRLLQVHPSGRELRRAVEDYLGTFSSLREGMPPFAGGVAGYFGYAMIEHWEDLFRGTRSLEGSALPRALLMGYATVVAVDHERDSILLIHHAPIGAEGLESALAAGHDHLQGLVRLLEEAERPRPSGPFFLGEVRAETEKAAFMKIVDAGREAIVDGEVCQVVLSQRFSVATDLPASTVYEALAEENPSPYLFLVETPEVNLIGSSPEVLVRLEGDAVMTRPLAGTRPRGRDEAADGALEAELLADEKERAEHLMLVDLARNDLGRICRTGSVTVTELMGVERYSRVMHIVSQVEGVRRPEVKAFDVLEAAFPAGTVSGAPKIRAMELIEELERSPRGPYAGAVGYLSSTGDLDTCIAIRTFVQVEGEISVQAGAGVVYDSVAEREYDETRNKAEALFRALKKAAEGGEGK